MKVYLARMIAVLLSASSVTVGAQVGSQENDRCNCRYPWCHRSFQVVSAENGRTIEFTEELKNLSLYYGQVTSAAVGEALDEVLAPIGVVSLSTSGRNLKPLPLDWSTPFESDLRCATKIVEAAGLQLLDVGKDAVLVGAPEYIESMPFIYFTFPLRAADRATPTGAGVEAAEIVKWLPQARSWDLIKDRWAAVGVGYAALEDGTGDWIAAVWNGESHGLKRPAGRIVRFRISRRFGRPWPECVWSVGVVGTPVLEFREDLDRDGRRDILIKGGVTGGEVSDKILSGASGKVLATFSGTEVVVSDLRSEDGDGALMTVGYVPGARTGSQAPILKFSADQGVMLVINENESNDSNADDDIAPDQAPHRASAIDRVLSDSEDWGGKRSGSRVYVLPGFSLAEAPPQDAIVVRVSDYFSELIFDKVGFEPRWFDELAATAGWINVVILYDPPSGSP